MIKNSMWITGITLIAFLSLVGCRTRKSINIDKAKYSYSIKLDSMTSDSSLEYVQIERTYTFNPSAPYDKRSPIIASNSSGIQSVKETIKSYKKTANRVVVKKDETGKGTSYKRKVTKDKQAGTFNFTIIFIVVLIVGGVVGYVHYKKQ